MKVQFTKIQAACNDYIYVEETAYAGVPENLAKRMSARHFSVGADGLVLIGESSIADARMRMFNADGSEGKMCGNAVRCVGKYLYDRGYVKKERITVETESGVKQLTLFPEGATVNAVSVLMGEALVQKNPLFLEAGGTVWEAYPVSVGNPHAVVFCPSVAQVPIKAIGPAFQSYSVFHDGVNVEFVQVINPTLLSVRVWERGSGETLACGTGACASAAAAVQNRFCRKDFPIRVQMPGGVLEVKEASEGGMVLTGRCETVYEGVYDDEDSHESGV